MAAKDREEKQATETTPDDAPEASEASQAASNESVAAQLQAEALAQAMAQAEAVIGDDEDTGENLFRPVVVYYDTDVAPTELHPAGMSAGTMYESPSPQVAYEFHPDARILYYVGGAPFNDRKVKAAIKKAAETE